MNNPKTKLSPDQLFAEAINQAGTDLSAGGYRLLVSGLTALRERQEKNLNEIELKSIYGMIAYVAYTEAVCETTVASVVTSKFKVEDVKTLPSGLYQTVIDFLIDLNLQTTIN